MNILAAPPLYVLSKDPVVFEIDTGVSLVSDYVLTLNYPTGDDGGGFVANIDVNGTVVPFTFPVRGIGVSDYDYSMAIIDALLMDMVIFSGTTGITIDPLDDTKVIISSDNPISASWVSAGIGWVWGTPSPISSNNQQLAVWLLMGSPLAKVNQQPMLFPIDSPQQVNVSALLTDNLLRADWLPDIPLCNQTVITENTITHQDFMVKFGLWENGALASLDNSGVFRGLFGGTGAWNEYINPHYPLLTLPASGYLGRFLTHQPRKKSVTFVQPEFLTWFHHENLINDIQVHVVAYNGDGTVGADFYPLNLVHNGAIVGHSYRLPVGPKAVDICNIYPDTVYYTVEVVNAANLAPISEKMTYVLVSHTKNTRYYVFLNSLGGIDTISTNTRMVATWENGRGIAVRSYSQDPNQSQYGQMFTYNADITRKYDLSTDFYDRCDVLWLQDLLLQNAWAAEWVQCKPCNCGCDDELECVYIPIIIDPKMSVPLQEHGKIRVDWSYQEAAVHGSYPVLGCGQEPLVGGLCEATFAAEVITTNFGVCQIIPPWGLISVGVVTINLHSSGLSPLATMELFTHGETGSYSPLTMPFNPNLSNPFWLGSGSIGYSDIHPDLQDFVPYDSQCFWLCIEVNDGACEYRHLFFMNKTEICISATPMYYALFENGAALDNTALTPIAIDTAALCTECDPD